MTYSAQILADSISPAGVRLTTMQVTFPRIVLAEFNTHRMFSRNSASSRAIPVEKRIAAVREDPFIPSAFLANRKGMQGGNSLDDDAQVHARERWLHACEHALVQAEALAEIGVHKQWANRLLEPFSWHTVIVTATEWDNFFAQRCSSNAQPEIRTIAEMMRELLAMSAPQKLDEGQWHLPLIMPEDVDSRDLWGLPQEWAKISAARCARVSYLTHEGKRDVDADLALYERLVSQGHMSPLEHAARPAPRFASEAFHGNLRGWVSLRKMIPGEGVYRGS